LQICYSFAILYRLIDSCAYIFTIFGSLSSSFIFAASDVLALAWPESHGFGLALGGSGLEKSQARPGLLAWAWLGLALA